jgi:hypothetical protein
MLVFALIEEILVCFRGDLERLATHKVLLYISTIVNFCTAVNMITKFINVTLYPQTPISKPEVINFALQLHQSDCTCYVQCAVSGFLTDGHQFEYRTQHCQS